MGGNAREQAGIATIVRSGKTERRRASRARIVLGAADGKSNNARVKERKTSRPAVPDWRRRLAEGGVKALYRDRPRGRSSKPSARAKEAGLLPGRKALPRKPRGRVAAAWPRSAAPVRRVRHANGPKP
ncbi:MAG: hypothetical protein WAM29_15755, partial [Methylocella sp.]